MRLIFKCLLLSGCLCILNIASAQVSQDLLDKAKSLGISDSDIKQGVSKLQGQSSTVSNPDIEQGDVVNNDLSQDSESLSSKQQSKISNAQWEYLLMLREDSIKKNLDKLVFGREIFLNKKLTFAPSLNIPINKCSVPI